MNNPQKLTPFKHFCLSIGVIPSAYTDAMAYYELLEWLCNYLQETVIPTVNNNSDVVTELQNLFVQLQDYVDNYFDNLDVQSEINHKLDEMVLDGTLTTLISNYVNPIYEAYETEINREIANQNSEIATFKNSVNTRLGSQDDTITAFENSVTAQINNQYAIIESVTSGSPLVASDTSEMTETDRIYVNTTDGKWYYYDGDSWEIGGTYQSSGIADNSVDIFKLSADLRDDFNIRYGTFEDLGTDNSGFTTNNDGVVAISSSSSYTYNVVNLTVNTIYIWNGYNSQYIRGLIIADADDNIIYDSETTVSGSEIVNYVFIPRTSGLKAYITYSNPSTANNVSYIRRIGGQLRKIAMISNKLRADTTMTKVETLTSSYFSIDTNQSSAWYNTPLYQSYNQSDCDVYAIEKGKKYTFNGYDWSSIKGIIITDNNFDVKDSTTGGGSLTEVTKTFIPDYDGFVFCHNIKNNGYTITCTLPTIDDIVTKVESDLSFNENNVGFTKYIAIGDSITEENQRCLHNYLYWINQDMPNLTITNLGVGGTGYKRTAGTGNNTFTDRLSEILSYNLDNTVITVFGSVNDLTYVENDLGQLGDTTMDTLYGAIYTFFNTLFTTFNGVRVGCISPFTKKSADPRLATYCQALKETCELFHVPFLDMRSISNLRPENSAFLNAYYSADGIGGSGEVDENGVHPNSAGHHLFYGRIKDFINTL